MTRDHSAIPARAAMTPLATSTSSNSVAAIRPTLSHVCSKGLRICRKFLLPLLLIAGIFDSSALAQSGQPNVVIILADDLGYGDVSFNGCPDYLTPNIDSFATNGVWCSSGYVTHPFCSPSRAGLLTGRYQQRFGHENQPDNGGLPLGELLLNQILKPAGYVSGAIGKWHLGSPSAYRPVQRGFDEFYGFLGGQSEYFNVPVFRNNTPVT